MPSSADLLGPASPVARALPGFTPRREQLEMAAAVEEALAAPRHLVVEAGTGVGKSFGYLVPLLLHVDGGGGPAVIATRTIALQEQLVGKDLPLLLGALGLGRLKVALAKGRGNYVCRRRCEMAVEEGRGLFGDVGKRKELRRIREWAETSQDGSLADLPFRPATDVWDAAKAESGNCLHKQCRFYETCAYQRSRRELYGAQLIVANHALVFADLALREAGAKILPDYRCLVLDGSASRVSSRGSWARAGAPASSAAPRSARSCTSCSTRRGGPRAACSTASTGGAAASPSCAFAGRRSSRIRSRCLSRRCS